MLRKYQWGFGGFFDHYGIWIVLSALSVVLLLVFGSGKPDWARALIGLSPFLLFFGAVIIAGIFEIRRKDE